MSKRSQVYPLKKKNHTHTHTRKYKSKQNERGGIPRISCTDVLPSLGLKASGPLTCHPVRCPVLWNGCVYEDSGGNAGAGQIDDL